MKINKLGLIIVLLVWSLHSCDFVYEYTYQVTNDTDSEVKLEARILGYDTTYSISAYETNILLVIEHGIEGAWGPYFEDVANTFDKFVVTKNDSLISTKDYLDNSSWSFLDGLYSSTIEESEFE